jgi:hypothetical protein
MQPLAQDPQTEQTGMQVQVGLKVTQQEVQTFEQLSLCHHLSAIGCRC